MPRTDAHLYRTVGCELLRTEVEILEARARAQRQTTGQVVRHLIREYLSNRDGVSAHNPPSSDNSNQQAVKAE